MGKPFNAFSPNVSNLPSDKMKHSHYPAFSPPDSRAAAGHSSHISNRKRGAGSTVRSSDREVISMASGLNMAPRNFVSTTPNPQKPGTAAVAARTRKYLPEL